MANFNIAYNNTGGHEGGWTVDNGGQTYQGISRKGWPTWKGWKLIDAWIKKNGTPRKGQYLNNTAIDNLVPAFYKQNYWDKIKGDAILNQTIANFVYDFYVNSNSAILKINSNLGATASSTALTTDSLSVINKTPVKAYEKIYAVRKNHYTVLSQKPKLKKYSKGWFARLAAFPVSLAINGIGDLQNKFY